MGNRPGGLARNPVMVFFIVTSCKDSVASIKLQVQELDKLQAMFKRGVKWGQSKGGRVRRTEDGRMEGMMVTYGYWVKA